MTGILKSEEETPDPEALRRAAEAIEDGELVVYPTETVYGLAADATSDEAVRRIYRAKSRPEDRPISVAVDSLSMAYQVGKLSRREADVIQEFLPGPLTLLVESRPLVSKILTSDSRKVGIRMPNHPVALGLIGAVGGPITSTSANVSGSSPPRRLDEALNQLGDIVGLAIDSGEAPGGTPSTVVDVSGGVEIVREGPISESEIRERLG